MAKDFAKQFYNSSSWKKCRRTYIEYRIQQDGGMCEICGQNLGYIVHHKINLSPENISNPDISLNQDYLMYVCKACHDLFEGHAHGNAAKPLCAFDEDGQPVSLRDIDSPHKRISK